MLHLIPSRQHRPTKDVIFSVAAEAARRKEAGEHVVNATIGALMHDDGSLAVMPTVTRTLEQVPPAEWAAYAPIAGLPGFTQAVMDDTFGTHKALREAACAVATPGGSGALRVALTSYLEPGQAVLVPNYFWSPYQTLSDEHERRVETFRMFGEDGTLDVASLESVAGKQLETQGRVLLILNDPCNNPTGYSMKRDEWERVAQALLRLAERGPVTLLVDMAYWLYGAAADHRAFMSSLEPLLGKVGLLFAWSASKSYTHYGLRVGALMACVPDPKARTATQAALSYACRGTWSNCNRGGQWAITRLLADPSLREQADADRAALKALLLKRVARFNEVAAPKKLNYPRYEGGFFVTVFHDRAEEKAEQMQGKGVFVIPQSGALRVALCSVVETDIPRLVDALGD